jgi:hypothetical protein
VKAMLSRAHEDCRQTGITNQFKDKPEKWFHPVNRMPLSLRKNSETHPLDNQSFVPTQVKKQQEKQAWEHDSHRR